MTAEAEFGLPTLTELILPVVGYTPAFLAGIIPAVLVVVSKEPQSESSGCLLMGSAAVLAVFICWMAVLAFGIDYVYARLSRVI